MSSANLSTLLDMSSSKSFIYIKNSIEPNGVVRYNRAAQVCEVLA